jgi:copper chaperone
MSTTPLSSHFAVEGMTCGHCVQSVTQELSALRGVKSVSVELAPGAASQVTVVSDEPLDTEVVRTAVDEAGYTLVP